MISEVPERVEDIQDDQPGINLGQRGGEGGRMVKPCAAWNFHGDSEKVAR